MSQMQMRRSTAAQQFPKIHIVILTEKYNFRS